MSTEIHDKYKFGITSDEFKLMVAALKSEETFKSGIETLYKLIDRVVRNKCKHHAGEDFEDLIQDVYLRLFKRISIIARDPIGTFSKGGRQIEEKDFGGCFHNYIVTTAKNILYDRYNKELPTDSIDDDKIGNVFLNRISDLKRMEDTIAEAEYILSVYQLCLKTLFVLRSKPYIVLGFCHNALIHFDESSHAKRGCSKRTAEEIANKTLGVLREELYNYHNDYDCPIPDAIIAPLDKQLKNEYNGKMYESYMTKEFYGANCEKTIADWTYNTRKSLVNKLKKEPLIMEFLKAEEFNIIR